MAGDDVRSARIAAASGSCGVAHAREHFGAGDGIVYAGDLTVRDEAAARDDQLLLNRN